MIISAMVYFDGQPKLYVFSNEGKLITNGDISTQSVYESPENVSAWTESNEISDIDALDIIAGVTPV